MKPTEEEIKEFWEKIKPKPKDWDEYNKWLYYGYPPVDLNSLFKHAMPKLKEKYHTEYNVVICLLTNWVIKLIYSKDDPAEALFWAIYEVMKK